MNYLNAILLFIVGLSAVYGGTKVGRLRKKIRKFLPAKIETRTVAIQDAKTSHRIRNPKRVCSVYTFTVNGIKFEGNTTYDINLTGAEKAFYPNDAIVRKNEVEMLTELWYNPENVTENFLKKTVLWPFVIVKVFGYLACAGSVMYLLCELFENLFSITYVTENEK